MKKDKFKKFLNDYMKWTPPRIVIILLLFMPFLLYFTDTFKLDNDFWFLVNSGKYIINNGIPYTEPFTIHTGLSFFVSSGLLMLYFI